MAARDARHAIIALCDGWNGMRVVVENEMQGSFKGSFGVIRGFDCEVWVEKEFEV